MSRDGSGTYNVVFTAVTGAVILASDYNTQNTDIGTALTASLAKDGQTVPTANLPMGNFKHTGVGNAPAATQYAAAGQVQNSSMQWGGTAGGTADDITISVTPSLTSYAAGQRFAFIAGSSRSGEATTININSLGAKTISNPVWANADVVEVIYNGTVFFAVAPTQADVTVIPSGTRKLYFQAAAPAGWTQYTAINDRIARIMSGTGAGIGGSWTFSGLSSTNDGHTHAINGSTANASINHLHAVSGTTGTPSADTSPASGGASAAASGHTHTISLNTEATDPVHAHTLSLNSGAPSAGHTHTGDGTWRPAFANVIICTKD